MECENEASVLFQTWYFVLVLGWEKEELQQWALCDNFGIKRKSILGGSGSMPPPLPNASVEPLRSVLKPFLCHCHICQEHSSPYL